MASKDKLHSLIKAMTPSEKRAFKIYAGRHVIGGENSYVKLFDALEKQAEYDEKALLKDLGGPRKVKYLSADKYYLYGLVLNSLGAFHADSSIDAKLDRQLHSAEILYEKGLYAQAGKILEKCRKLAMVHDKFEQLLRIKYWEREMAFRLHPAEGLVKYLNEYYEEVEALQQLLNNRYAYHGASDKVFALHKTKGAARNEKDLQAYRKLYNSDLLDHESRALSFDGKRFLFAARMFHYHATGDLKKSHEARRKLVQLIESNSGRLQANPKSYIYALNNLLISCIQMRNELEFHDTIGKLDTLPSLLPSSAVTPDLKARIFESRFIHETDFLIKFARFEEGAKLNAIIEKQLPEVEAHLDRAFLIALCNNMMCLYFGVQKYRKSLQWLNRILDDRTGDVREDIICFARIVNLILHYELGNQLILPYLLRSTYRFLSQRKSTLKYERLVLDTMKKILRVKEESELLLLFSALEEKLSQLTDDPYERVMMEDLNLIAWLESKVSGRSYAEVVQ